MKAALEPCDHKDTGEGPTVHTGTCGTDYCGGWLEFRCPRCGWWSTSCPCGACNSESKLSSKQEKAIYRRVKARAVADALEGE